MNQDLRNILGIMIVISGVFLFVGSIVFAKSTSNFFLSFLVVIIGAIVGIGMVGSIGIKFVSNYD